MLQGHDMGYLKNIYLGIKTRARAKSASIKWLSSIWRSCRVKHTKKTYSLESASFLDGWKWYDIIEIFYDLSCFWVVFLYLFQSFDLRVDSGGFVPKPLRPWPCMSVSHTLPDNSINQQPLSARRCHPQYYHVIRLAPWILTFMQIVLNCVTWHFQMTVLFDIESWYS